MNKLAIIDYGLGNLFGLKQACSAVGLETVITNEKKEISNAKGIILPGVGAFGTAMNNLKNIGIIDEINKSVKSGKILLGLCLGMQLLMNRSFEFGEHTGLNYIEGDIEYLVKKDIKNNVVKIPHIGWNAIKISESFSKDIIFRELPNSFDVYFVHSYCLFSSKKQYILSETTYENIKFCSAVKKDNVIGLQFHPENSGPNGLKLLSNIFNKQ
tara:strand:+ start:818 stop:1456 length:639 start_codon:yes stop_codon:yes gene_type:complete